MVENQTASPRDGENQTVLEHGVHNIRLQREFMEILTIRLRCLDLILQAMGAKKFLSRGHNQICG